MIEPLRPPEFEELAYHHTPLGELILRRRTVPSLGHREVFEVKLDGAFLMSSLNTASEVALAERALEWRGAAPTDVLVGGLGLGYTAQAALARPHVRTLTVVEFLKEVIDWHRRGLVPLGAALCGDARCTLVAGDFFALARGEALENLPPGAPSRWGAVLVDIDHAPEHLLAPAHGALYTAEGLARVRDQLAPRGVFALWSADPPAEAFVAKLKGAFERAEPSEVDFYDPLFDERKRHTVYLAQRSG